MIKLLYLKAVYMGCMNLHVFLVYTEVFDLHDFVPHQQRDKLNDQDKEENVVIC